MSGFFSANVTSPFPDQNALYDAAKVANAGQAYQSNQLHMQGQQLDLTAADHEQVGRLAAGLLNIKDPAARAQAYAQGVGVLQSQGLAKYAPPTLPDEQSLQMLVNQTVPVQDQYKMGLITVPGLTDALARSNAPLPGQPGYGGAGLTPAGAAAGGFGAQLAQSESSGKSNVINQQGYTGTYQFGKQRLADLGYYTPAPGEDMKDNTKWAGKVSVPGFNVTDQASFAANPAAQQAVFNTHLGDIDKAIDQMPNAGKFDRNGLRAVAHLGGISGMERFASSGGAYDPADANGTRLSAYYQRFSGGGTQTAAVPTGGVAARTGGTDTAGPGAGQVAPPGPAQPPGAAVAPAQPGQPQPAPSTIAQPMATPPTGVNSPQFQAALELNHRAAALETQFPNSPQAKAQAASLRAQAALYMQADSVSVDPTTGIQTKQLTGERLNAAAPNAHYVWNEQQGAYVDTTGVHPPVTPPSPRLTATPGGAILQSKPGGGATVVYQTPPADITTQEAAKTAGAALGTAGVKQVADLANQGRTAAQAIGNIDYGMSQVQKAKAGGINTGYFAPWLSTIGAIAKSIGGDTGAQLLGIDPTAVGNTQTAAKTLAVVSGAILNQILGPESQVTDAKIQHFIHAQPGIETDPDALGRVLNWARTQFVYEREMAAQGMKDAKSSGALPLGWQANYFDQHGFAPIYNPGTGEMQQPEGQAPSRTAPATLSAAPINPAERKIGTIYITKNLGPATWTEQGWLKAQ